MIVVAATLQVNAFKTLVCISQLTSSSKILPSFMILQQVAEFVQLGFVGGTCPSQSDAFEFNHGQGVEEGIAHSLNAQIKLGVKDEDAQQALKDRPQKADGLPSNGPTRAWHTELPRDQYQAKTWLVASS
jgi:hypothetical protein